MRTIAITALLFASACGGSSGSSAGAAPDFSSSGSGTALTVPFVAIQPEDYRLAASAQNLKNKIGHEVNVDVDADLLKQHGQGLSDVLAEALETIGRGVDRARLDEPSTAAHSIATIAALKFQLDEKTRDTYAVYDGHTGALVIHVPTNSASFTTDQAIAAALTAGE